MRQSAGAPPLLSGAALFDLDLAHVTLLSLFPMLSATAAILLSIFLTARPAPERVAQPEFHN